MFFSSYIADLQFRDLFTNIAFNWRNGIQVLAISHQLSVISFLFVFDGGMKYH